MTGFTGKPTAVAKKTKDVDRLVFLKYLGA
jgi:hypothetical protein